MRICDYGFIKNKPCVTYEYGAKGTRSRALIRKKFRHNKAVIQCTLYKISPLQSFNQSVAMRLVYCRFKSKKVEQVIIQFINSYLKYQIFLYMIQHSS